MEISWPKTGVTHYHIQSGLSNKSRTIKAKHKFKYIQTIRHREEVSELIFIKHH